MVSKRPRDSNDLGPESWVQCAARISASRHVHFGDHGSDSRTSRCVAEKPSVTVVFRIFTCFCWCGVYSESQLPPPHNRHLGRPYPCSRAGKCCILESVLLE